jgi:hypothetical protein
MLLDQLSLIMEIHWYAIPVQCPQWLYKQQKINEQTVANNDMLTMRYWVINM